MLSPLDNVHEKRVKRAGEEEIQAASSFRPIETVGEVWSRLLAPLALPLLGRWVFSKRRGLRVSFHHGSCVRERGSVRACASHSHVYVLAVCLPPPVRAVVVSSRYPELGSGGRRRHVDRRLLANLASCLYILHP
jgi:hypothetical protein